MLFSSITFLFYFLPLTIISWIIFHKNIKITNILLLIFSLIFYAWGEITFVLVILFSIILNYFLGKLIHPFSAAEWNDWNSSVVWFKDNRGYARDACKEHWGGYQGAVSLVDKYLKKITTILAYFHSQTNSNTSISYGDSVYTSMYSTYRS